MEPHSVGKARHLKGLRAQQVPLPLVGKSLRTVSCAIGGNDTLRSSPVAAYQEALRLDPNAPVATSAMKRLLFGDHMWSIRAPRNTQSDRILVLQSSTSGRLSVPQIQHHAGKMHSRYPKH